MDRQWRSVILILFVLVVATVFSTHCGSDRPDEFRMVNMTDEELKSWYGAYDFCALKATTKADRTNCPVSSDMECSATHHFDKLPLVFYQQPVDRVTGVPYPKYSAIDMMLEMNRSKKMLVLFGDSISREFIKSLYCGMKSDNSLVTMQPPLGKRPFGAVLYDIFIPFKNGTVTSVRFMFCGIYAAMSKRDIGDRYFANALKNFVWKSIFDNSTNSAVVLFNIGLHDREPTHLRNILDYSFKWAQSDAFRGTTPPTEYSTSWGVTGSNPGGNVFIFREASLQDYPDTETTSFGKINMDIRQHWLNGSLPFPTCTSFLCSPDPPANTEEVRLSEDVAAEAWALDAAEKRFTENHSLGPVYHVHFRNFARHFYAMHPASKFVELDPNFRNILSSWTDRTHYTYTPLIHHPTWSEVWNIIRKEVADENSNNK